MLKKHLSEKYSPPLYVHTNTTHSSESPPSKELSEATSSWSGSNLLANRYKSTSTARVMALFFPLAFALILGLPGLSAGLPYLYDEDEAHHFNRTVNMVKQGDFNPHYFLKPSLHFYLRMPVVAASFLWEVKRGRARELQEIVTVDPEGVGKYAFSASHPGMVKWNRGLSLLLSLGTVLVASLLALRIAESINLPLALSNWAALVAGLFVAASPALTAGATIIGVDVVVSFFATWCALTVVRFKDDPSWSRLGLIATLSGLAIGTKYNVAPIIILPLLCALFSPLPRAGALVIGVTLPILVFCATTPFLFAELPLFLNHVAYEIWHYGIAGHGVNTGEPGLEQAIFYGSWFASEGIGPTALLALTIPGVIVAITKSVPARIIATFAGLYFLEMCAQRANFPRNMHLIVPLLATAAGIGASLWLRGAMSIVADSKRRKVAISLSLLLPIAPLTPLLIRDLSMQDLAQHPPESRQAILPHISNFLERSPTSEIAVDPSLQMVPSIYQDKRFTRTRTSDINLIQLINAGFDGVLARGLQSKDPILQNPNARALISLTTISGIYEEQRVVANPTLSFSSLQISDSLRTLGSIFAEQEHLPILDLSELPASHRDNEGDNKEPYLWLQHRATKLLLPPKFLDSKTGVISLYLFTPWGNTTTLQQIAAIFPPSSEIVPLAPLSAGEWSTRSLVPPPNWSRDTGIIMLIREVHAPAALGISQDTRRLGVALKDVPPNS